MSKFASLLFGVGTAVVAASLIAGAAAQIAGRVFPRTVQAVHCVIRIRTHDRFSESIVNSVHHVNSAHDKFGTQTPRASGAADPTDQQRHYRADQEQEEQDASNAGRARHDAGKSHDRSDDCNDEKYCCVVKHFLSCPILGHCLAE